MKVRILISLLLLTSVLYSQNAELTKVGKPLTPESFYKMQYAVEDQGFNAKPADVVNLLESAVKLAENGKLDTLSVIKIHARCRELMFFALRQQKLTMDEVKSTFASLDGPLNTFLACEKKSAYYRQIFLKDSTSTPILEEVVKGLLDCNCQGVDIYMKSAKRLYDKDTTPEKALYLAKYFLKKNGYGFALPLLQKACNSSDPIIASNANMEIAGTYRFYNRLEEGLKFARKAIQLNPNNGMAYVIIGDLYYLGASTCGETDLEKTGALWASYEKYQKALKTDASLRDIVRIRLAVLNNKFPDTTALTALKLTEGAPYKVGCWIKETTQVRARKTQ